MAMTPPAIVPYAVRLIPCSRAESHLSAILSAESGILRPTHSFLLGARGGCGGRGAAGEVTGMNVRVDRACVGTRLVLAGAPCVRQIAILKSFVKILEMF